MTVVMGAGAERHLVMDAGRVVHWHLSGSEEGRDGKSE